MNEQKFKIDFMALVAAKLQSPDPDFVSAKMSVYWECLKNIPNDLWQRGVAYCLRHGSYFPSVEELAEASIGIKWRWTKTPNPEKIPWEDTLGLILAKRRQIAHDEKTGLTTFIEKSQGEGS